MVIVPINALPLKTLLTFACTSLKFDGTAQILIFETKTELPSDKLR